MKKFSWLFPFLLIAFIFYNSSLDAVQSSGMSSPLAEGIKQLFHLPYDVTSIEFFIRKLAHFSEYAALGGLVALAEHFQPIKKIPTALVYAFFLIIPVFDENIQRFSLGRSCEVRDMLIDASGYIFGLVLVILILEFYCKRRHFKHVKMES